MEYIQLSMDDYIQSKTEIKKELGGIVKSFVRIGWQLTCIDRSGAYKLDGYNTIAEFAKAEYGMNPSGVTRFMNVYEKYSVPGDTPELQEKYREFNFSQLTEMLQISDEDKEMFLPEAKRESIREFKNYTKENENNPDNLMNWQKEPEDLIGKAILEFFRKNKEETNTLFGSEAYTKGNIKEMAEILNPSGNRHFRHKTVFIMMYEYEKGIMVNEFGKSPEGMKWEQFFAIAQDIFKEAAAGHRTWENYFGEEIAPAQKQDAEKPENPVPEEPKPETSPEPEETEPEEKQDNCKKEPEKAPEQKQEDAEKIPECQKTAHTEKTTSALKDFQPKDHPEPPKPELEKEEKCQETALEPQIPGQDSIENHPEYMPVPEKTEPEQETTPENMDTEPVPEEPEIAPAQTDILEKTITRKEYIDSLTAYGTAKYLAKAMLSFRNKSYNTLLKQEFWEDWLDGKVDRNERTWVD